MVWGKAGSTTLSSAGDTMTISGMTANNSYVYLYHAPANASYNTIINFDNDSGTKYAERKSANGGADSTAVSQTDFNTGDGTNSDGFHFGYIVDVSGEETLIIDWWNRANTAGAGNAPYRGENVGKFTGTTQFTRIDFDNSSGGSGFATDSNLSVIGSDITPAAAIPFPTNVQVGSRAEITDTRKMYNFTDPALLDTDFSSSTGWSQTGTQHSVNTSTGVIDWNGAASTSVHALSYDLGAVVEDNWILRFKWVIENHTLGSNPGGWVSIGLSDSDDTVGGSANQDSVSLGSYVGGGTNKIRFHHGNDGSMRQNFTDFSTTNEEATWYVQIVKTGTSVTIGLYPDSTYGTATESKTQTISGTGFRYVVVKSRSDNTNGGSVYNGTIDDMAFYNNTTTQTSKYWQEIGA